MDAVYTIGVYGFDEGRFLDTLRANGIDLLVDVRRRRGVRGREYAFANSARLQASLADAGIRYAHVLGLAPDNETRGVQYAADDAQGIGKRNRTVLSDGYVRLYRERTLDPFAWDELDAVVAESRRPALLCVEASPDACHRGMVAAEYARRRGVATLHLTP